MNTENKITKVMIGMPVYNDFRSFAMAIDSIYHTTNYPFKLVIIESESTDGSKEYSDLLTKIYPNKDIEIIHTKKEGPLAAYNLLFKKALDEEMDLYLTQTDVLHPNLFNRDWLKIFVDTSKHPQCGLVTSLGGGFYSNDRYLDGFYWVGGWSCYIPHRIIKEFGSYDINFEIGDGVDIEYTFRICSKGYLIRFTNFSVDHHRFSAHQNEERIDLEDIKKRNGRYFRRKYHLGREDELY